MTIDPTDPLAVAATEAIQSGDLDRLRRLLAEHPGLATARLGDDRPGGMTRTLLHVTTDWPGHFPNGSATVGLLVEAGTDVNAPLRRRPPRRCPAALGGQQRRRRVLDALGAADPLDAAARSGADDLVAWLRAQGAKPAKELAPGG